MSIRNLSIKTKLVLTFLSISTIIILVVTYFNFLSNVKQEKNNFIQNSLIQANLLADFTASALIFVDYEGAEENLDKLKNDKNILRVIIFDKDKNIFAQYNPFYINDPANLNSKKISLISTDNYFLSYGTLKLHIPIKFKNQTHGTLYIEKSTKIITKMMKTIFVEVVFFAFILLLLTYVISIILSNHFLEPILFLAKTSEKIALTQNYRTRVKYDSKNEIGSLYKAFNTLVGDTEKLTDDLEDQVKIRTKELNYKTEQLEDSLSTLQQAQQQLIESEKMSALGNLVSGIAHEVNTPLGNAITSSSIIIKETEYLNSEYKNQTLTRSGMEKRLNILNESSSLLVKTLNYASELIKSFKQISIDQVTNDIRVIDIKEYIKEIVLTNHNKLKLIPVKVNIEGEDIEIKTSPGIIAQILNNLIQNSITHGFEYYIQNSQININIKKEDDNLILEYEDNGKGINSEIKETIYEPFVTTKRNLGGTGLGLNIVYNLVHQKLKGSIKMQTQENVGTKFIFRLPIYNSFEEKK
jgi:signal transduction histidine kinase